MGSPPAAIDDLHAAVAARLRAIGSTSPAERRSLVDLLAGATRPLAIAQILESDRSLAQSSVYRNLAVLEQADVTLPDAVESTVDRELATLARRHGFTPTAA